jgi:hypothetical protein
MPVRALDCGLRIADFGKLALFSRSGALWIAATPRYVVYCRLV